MRQKINASTALKITKGDIIQQHTHTQSV